MDDAVLESELLDVTDIKLEQLDALPDSVLRAALRRVLAERADMPDRYTIHESSL
jgi:FXSXX-COOH protein